MFFQRCFGDAKLRSGACREHDEGGEICKLYIVSAIIKGKRQNKTVKEVKLVN